MDAARAKWVAASRRPPSIIFMRMDNSYRMWQSILRLGRDGRRGLTPRQVTARVRDRYRMSSLRNAGILLLGIPCAFAAACRSAGLPPADQLAGFRQLLSVSDPPRADTLCVAVARGDNVHDAAPEVVSALRAERVNVRPMSACGGPNGRRPGQVRLFLTRASTRADTLLVGGADSRGLTYDCRVSRSGSWRASCAISQAS